MKKITLTILEDKNWNRTSDDCDGFRASNSKKEFILESDDDLPSGLTFETDDCGEFKLIIP